MNIKTMTFELSSTLMIILLCWIILTVADVAVCGLLKLIFGLPFKKAFLWGLLSLLLPPVLPLSVQEPVFPVLLLPSRILSMTESMSVLK